MSPSTRLPSRGRSLQAARADRIQSAGPAGDARRGGLTANSVPLQLHAAPPGLGVLRAHVARANPFWRDAAGLAEALVVFRGVDAYISPSWYATKRETGKVVPTWNYTAVHAYGAVRVIDDRDWLRRQIDDLTAAHESGRPAPWSVDDAPAGFIDDMLAGVVGIEIEISRIEGSGRSARTAPTRIGPASPQVCAPSAATPRWPWPTWSKAPASRAKLERRPPRVNHLAVASLLLHEGRLSQPPRNASRRRREFLTKRERPLIGRDQPFVGEGVVDTARPMLLGAAPGARRPIQPVDALREGRRPGWRTSLRRARPWHEQLSPADRAPERRPAGERRDAARRRRLLPHRSAGRGPWPQRPHQRGGDRPHAQGAGNCRDKMHARGVTRARLVATQACRGASNGDEFTARVRDHTGLELEIIDRETEARFAARGCGSLVDRSRRACCCSTSAAARPNSCGSPARGAGARRHGAVRLDLAGAGRRHPLGAFRRRHVSADTFAAMTASPATRWRPSRGRWPIVPVRAFICWAPPARSPPSPASTLAWSVTIDGASRAVDVQRRARPGHHAAARDGFQRARRQWLHRPAARRSGAGGLRDLRGDPRGFPGRRTRIADRGLREGMLLELMEADGALPRSERV